MNFGYRSDIVQHIKARTDQRCAVWGEITCLLGTASQEEGIYNLGILLPPKIRSQ